MVADHLIGIDKLETDLWKLADRLRANSNLASNEYFLTIMGLIFLRHATHRFDTARSAIEADKAAGKMPNRPLVAADFSRRRALMLSDRACYDVILKTPKDGNLGAALNAAMETVEKTFPPLAGQLPKDYERFDNDLLDRMLRMFDGEALRTAAGDFAAWLGLTPLQKSTGGKQKLGAVSKRGERTIRRLLILGASAVIRQACLRGAPAGSWLAQLLPRKPKMLVIVALANKMARVVWALLVKGGVYKAPVVAA